MDSQQGTLAQFMARYGKTRVFAPGEIVCRQGMPSDGLYYLQQGRLRVYREEGERTFHLSEIAAGEIVGELGAATGWVRTATVEAVEESSVIHLPETDFRRALLQEPDLSVEIARLATRRLTNADMARVTLDRSCQLALARVDRLGTEKAQLEELLLLREELANMIVHDLRNPLSVISGGIQLLESLSRGSGSEAEAILSAMDRAARRMKHLVDTLLDIARLEAGKMALQLTRVDVGALVAESAAEQQSFAQARNIALTSQAPAGLYLSADADVLQRVLTNLLDNALKFTPEGGRVWVEVQPDADGVQIAVADSGPGIPPEERERVFEKFTQLKSQQGARHGSGLGLTFCRMAVEAHGGRIWIEDGPGGVGSRFVVALPAAEA